MNISLCHCLGKIRRGGMSQCLYRLDFNKTRIKYVLMFLLGRLCVLVKQPLSDHFYCYFSRLKFLVRLISRGGCYKANFPSNTFTDTSKSYKKQSTSNYCFPIRLFFCLGASLVCVKRKCAYQILMGKKFRFHFSVGWNQRN